MAASIFAQHAPTHDRRLIPHYEAVDWVAPRELPGTALGPRDLYNLKQFYREKYGRGGEMGEGEEGSFLSNTATSDSYNNNSYNNNNNYPPRRLSSRTAAMRQMNKFINKTTTSWVSTNTKTTVILPSASTRIVPDSDNYNNNNNIYNNEQEAAGSESYFYVSNPNRPYTDRVEVLPDTSYVTGRVPTPPGINNNNNKGFLPSLSSPVKNAGSGMYNNNNNNKMSAADYADLDRRLNSTPRDTGVAEFLEL